MTIKAKLWKKYQLTVRLTTAEKNYFSYDMNTSETWFSEPLFSDLINLMNILWSDNYIH